MGLPAQTRTVVTGAGSGLGRAFCVELARRGARIVAADINLESARETVGMLNGSEAHAVQCDVADASAVEALASRADALFGGTDLLINNAGVAVSGKVEEIPLKDWQWIVGVNLFGVIHGCHTFLPRFRAQNSGTFINVASAAGLLSTPQTAPYGVTKAGVVALSEALAAEVSNTKIRVTVLCPMFFHTNIAASARGERVAEMQGRVESLMKRTKVQADDVARIALLAADRGELYALPHADGRWLWRVKRAAPGLFNKALQLAYRRGYFSAPAKG